MKKIGLIGGISWTSTVDYYRYINEGINKALGGLNYAECLIYSVNFKQFAEANAAHDWDANYRLLSDAGLQLKKAGAEAIVLCANTAHIMADRIEERVQLPLINIITATSTAIKQQKLKKVGLLGTSYTMELGFYKDKLREAGIESIIPAKQEDRNCIQQVLRDELGKGIILPESKRKYLSIIEQLTDDGAEGIILGCTEIRLLIQQDDISVPVFDTTKIHSQAIVDYMLEN